MSLSQTSLMSRGRDSVLFSGLWPAAVALALVAVCDRALGDPVPSPTPWGAMGLAATGTLVVYNIDRLRDLERDRASSPGRTAFVEQHRGGLVVLAALAALASLLLAIAQPPVTWLLCASALGLGLFHRRLKGHPAYAVIYVTAAWVAVVVGLPAAGQSPRNFDAAALVWVAITLALVIAANVLASELREMQPGPQSPSRLRIARGLAAAGTLLPGLGASTGVLVPVGACTFLALLWFRSDERYGLGVLDGALLLGALLGLAIS